MALSAQERRRLMARGNRMHAAATISGRELSETAVLSLRQLLAREELAKVRVSTDDRAVFAAVAEQVAARVPCELVQRIGRVMLIYRPRETPEPSQED